MANWTVVSWNPGEVMTSKKMNQMAQRDDYLNEHKVRGVYSAHGVKRESNLVIVTGVAVVPASKTSSNRVPIKFPSVFSGSCRPGVTTGMISPHLAQVFINTSGLGSSTFPTAAGFDIHAVMSSAYPAAKRKLKKMYVAWTAVGY